MTDASVDPDDFERILEFRIDEPPALVHPGWAETFPWLVQGTTARRRAGVRFDLGLFSSGSEAVHVRRNWVALRAWTGMKQVVHAQQVHGVEVCAHGGMTSMAGIEPVLVSACDGHATGTAGVLLTVATADCVPVFIVDAERRAACAVHAGWRGAAAGVFERGVGVLIGTFGSSAKDLHVHFGPAICGACYEVGTEVFEALGQPVPDGPTPIDLRAILAARAVQAGVEASRVSISRHCTRCTDSDLFSHRGGDAGRQVGYLGVRDT